MQSIYRNEDIKKYRIEFMLFSFLCLGAIPFLIHMKHLGDDLSFGSAACFVSDHFHLYCPGCGGTRSVIALLKGQFLSSLIFNPYPMCICVMIIRIWCTLFYDSFLAGEYCRLVSPLSYAETWGMFFLALFLFVVRNVLLLYFHIDMLGDLAIYRF